MVTLMPGENPPVPDPTVLTTDAVERAVDAATALLEAKIAGVESVIAEQLQSVATQFTLIERQRVEQKADTEKAVQAALSAAKEAVKEQTAASDKSITKSETAMTEQLKQLTATFTTAVGGVTDILGDLKERVGRIESLKAGAAESRTSISSNANLVIGALGVLVAALAIVVVVILSNGAGP